MKMRTPALGVLAGAIACFTALPTYAQSKLIQRLDVNGDGKVSRDELVEGSAMRSMFDKLVEQYKLDPKKTYTLKELEEASGIGGSSSSGSTGGSSGSSSRTGDSRPAGPGSPGSSFRFGDPRRGPSGSSRGSSGSRTSRSPSDGRPFRALEDLPGEYRSYDKDGDGQVGLYEWPKDRIRDFIALDRNDDGFLTISELKKPSSSSQNGEKDRGKEEKKSEPDTAPSDGEKL